MANYTVKDTQTGKTITFVWNGEVPPTETDMAEVFSSARGQTPSEQPGFFSRVGSDLYKRGSNIVDTLSKKSWGDIPKAETLLQVAGDVAGAGNDIVTEGIKSVGNTIVPDRIKGYVKEAGRAIIETPIGQQGIRALKTGAEAYGEFKRQYPDVAKDIESVVNIASFIPLAKGVKATGSLAKEIGEAGIKTTKPLVQEFSNVGKDILSKVSSKTPEVIEKQIKLLTDKGIEKGIRPSVSGKHRAPDTAKYLNEGNTAVKEIITNKNSLALTNETGTIVKGELPQTLNQFSDAIHQTKKTIFKQYDDMAKAAGEEIPFVDTSNAIKEMTSLANDKVVNTVSPHVSRYAKEMADRLAGQNFTTSEMQDMIAMLNKKLDAFYKNPSFENANIAGADSLLANNLRRSLDKSIESVKGKGYQELKNKYGALKSIENDVVHRAIVDARKNVKGLLDFSDMFSSAELVSGIATMSPGLIIKGGVVRGIKEYIKRTNDPNNIIKNMFKKVDSLMDESSGLPRSRAFAKSSPWNPPEGSIEFNKNPLRMDTDYTPNNQAIRGDIEMPSGLEMDRQKVFDAGNVWARPQGVTYGGQSPQAIGSPPMRGEFNPSVQGTPGSKEQAVFFKGTIPTTYYSHPNLGDETKTYWVNEAAKMRAAEEARIRYGK